MGFSMDKSTGVGCHFLLQIFQTQGLNPGLLHRRQMPYRLSHQGSKLGENIYKSYVWFRYNLNQIPYDCTVEVRNRSKGLDLIDRLLDELWTEVHDIVQETGIMTISKEKKCKKAKWLSGEALQILWKEEKWKAKEKRKDIPIWMQSSTCSVTWSGPAELRDYCLLICLTIASWAARFLPVICLTIASCAV